MTLYDLAAALDRPACPQFADQVRLHIDHDTA